jgi:hypothetical protein
VQPKSEKTKTKAAKGKAAKTGAAAPAAANVPAAAGAPAAAKAPAAAAKGSGAKLWIAIGGVAAALAIGALVFVLGRGGDADSADLASLETAVDESSFDATVMMPQPLPPELDAESGVVDAAADPSDGAGEAAQSSTYRIVTRPAGATVLVDGVAVDQVTPADIDLAGNARHSIEIELEGHKPVSWTFAADRLTADQQRSRKLYFPLTAIVTAAAPSLGGPPPGASSTAASAPPPLPPSIVPPSSPPGQIEPGIATVRAGKEVPMPRKVQDAGPSYSRDAVPTDRQPIVILELTLDPQGQVANAKVLRGLSTDLDEIARRTTYLWRYEVTPHKGKPVNTVLTSTVIFEAP